jgi:hypothetical protein
VSQQVYQGSVSKWRAQAVFSILGFCVVACGATPTSRFPNADAAIHTMRAGLACNRAIGGEAKIDYMDEHGRVRGSIAVLAALPDRTRLDAFSPFGVSISTLTTDHGSFAYYDLSHRQFLEGPASPCNIARFTQVPMPAFALVQLLRGEAPVLKHTVANSTIDWSTGFFGGGHYEIELRGNNESVERIDLSVHPDDFARPWQEQRVRVTRVALRQQGIPLYEALLDDHRVAETASPREDPDGLEASIPPSGPVCRAELPRRLRLVIPDTERDLVVHFETVHHNPPLIDGAFRQQRPDGVSVVFAECPQR